MWKNKKKKENEKLKPTVQRVVITALMIDENGQNFIQCFLPSFACFTTKKKKPIPTKKKKLKYGGTGTRTRNLYVILKSYKLHAPHHRFNCLATSNA